MKHYLLAGLVLVTGAGVGLGLAQGQQPRPQPEAEADSDAGAAAIRAVSASFVKAFNAKDAKTVGSLFSDGAEIEDDDGTVTRGREAIVERFVQRFAEGGGGTLSVAIDSIRFLGSELAVEEGTATIKDPDDPAPEINRYTVLYIKQEGRWLQARIKDETPDAAAPKEQLKELDWLLGEWVNESDDAIVSTTCDWSDDGSFLMRKFDIKIEGVVALKGSQRIGWDAAHKQFRTWIFDTQGGFAEGFMARDGDRWVVKVSGVRSDGQTVTATNIITRLGKDRLGWESAERTLGGTAVPGIDQFIVVRKPPEPSR